MRARDQIEIVEAAYDLETEHEGWQLRLTELVERHWGGGALSYTYDASEPSALRRGNLLAVGFEDEVDMDALRGNIAATPLEPRVARSLFLAGPHLMSLVESLGPRALETPDYVRAVRAEPVIGAYSVGLRTLDPSGVGICFALPTRVITDRARRDWGRLASHMAIGYRLRRALERVAAGQADETGDAILDLEGHCAHAEGEAKSAEARQALREAARRVMRARGSLRRQDSEQALEIWKGLVAGRWSLVDRFDSDGKHYLVAHRNPPELHDQRALTPREAQVASYLALGLSNKLIGYSLGITTSSVADHIASIAKKLRTTSRVELVRFLGAFGSDQQPA